MKENCLTLLRHGVLSLCRLQHPRILSVERRLEESSYSLVFVTERIQEWLDIFLEVNTLARLNLDNSLDKVVRIAYQTFQGLCRLPVIEKRCRNWFFVWPVRCRTSLWAASNRRGTGLFTWSGENVSSQFDATFDSGDRQGKLETSRSRIFNETRRRQLSVDGKLSNARNRFETNLWSCGLWSSLFHKNIL